MTAFEFSTVRALVCGPGTSTALAARLSALGTKRVLIVTDPGLRELGLLDEAVSGIAKAGIAYAIYDRVEADPPEAIVLAAIAAAHEFRADGVVGFGGGSPMDVAKLVALLAASEQPLAEAYGIGMAKGSRLPLVQVATTAGTGSEVTPISIVTTGDGEKKGVIAPQLLPDVAILDPVLTVTVPPAVTAATGVDAMVHAIEAFTSRVKKNPISDSLACQALRLLAANIERVCTVPDDLDARGNMLLGAALAGMAFANAPVAAVHALAYPVGSRFHVPHGLSNALVLLPVLRFNLPVADAHYATLAECVADRTHSSRGFLDTLERLIARLPLQLGLRSVGIGRNHLPTLAEDAMKQTRLLTSNPRTVTYDDALRLYGEAL